MISRISGKIVERYDLGLLLEVNGLCYEVMVPLCIMSALDGSAKTDGTISLVTFHYHQLEPSRATPVLIGFLNDIEKEFFEKFITVSGVGPKAAVKALAIPIPKIADAIDRGDLALLKTLPGIGEQRAREIVAKLQGKVGKFGLIQDRAASRLAAAAGDIEDEAMAILLQLQYKKDEAKEMVRKAIDRNPNIKTSEDILNEVYREKKVK